MRIRRSEDRPDWRGRGRGARLAVGLVLGALAVLLFRVQVLGHARRGLDAPRGSLRVVPVPAPRGTIYGRDGRVLAGTARSRTLVLFPVRGTSVGRTLERLAPLVGLTPERVAELRLRHRAAPTRPLVVERGLSFDELAAVEERRYALPGIYIETRPRRRYPAGAAVRRVVGYVHRADAAGVRSVGRAGLEARYDSLLAGRPGVRYLKVGAHGNVVGEPAGAPGVAPVPGRDLHLFLDFGLQHRIARLVPDSVRAAAIALDPRTGHVLALVSSPGPSRAIGRLYPPGATFLLVTAAIGLRTGALDPEAYLPIPCRGGMRYGNRYFRCGERAGHGYLRLADAIAASCRVYFYQAALKIGLERLLRQGVRLGFRRVTGIDLPDERGGRFPAGPGWYREHTGHPPGRAAALELAVGGGPNAQTVLKMAHFYAALATDGRVPPPRLARAARPVASGLDLGLSPEALGHLRAGLRRAGEPAGTDGSTRAGRWWMVGQPARASGLGASAAGAAWYIGVAGAEKGEPEIVMAVVVESGRRGAAALYARRAMDYYLQTVHGSGPIAEPQHAR